MFTGLIEEVGSLISKEITRDKASLKISSHTILDKIKLGDSISTNGVCLTVTDYSDSYFIVDVMPKTLQLSNLGSLNQGDYLNLEPALTLSTRLGGHMVSGHIDTTATIINISPLSNAILITLEILNHDTFLVIPRGSISIDGISLTIAELDKSRVTVSIIPHTYRSTNLCHKGIGDIVNIEYDLIGKYIKNHMIIGSDDTSKDITMDFLKDNNFI